METNIRVFRLQKAVKGKKKRDFYYIELHLRPIDIGMGSSIKWV